MLALWNLSARMKTKILNDFSLGFKKGSYFVGAVFSFQLIRAER